MGWFGSTPSFLQHSEDCQWRGDKCTCRIWDVLGTNSVEPLIKRLAETEEIETKQNIIGALGNIGDTRAVEPLIKILKESKFEMEDIWDGGGITWHAATALGLIGDERAYEPMIQALGYSKESESIPYWLKGKGRQTFDYAGNPLGVTRSKLTVNTDALARALGDSVEDVRNYCVEILDEVKWKPETEKQKIDYWIIKEKWEEIIKLGKPAVPRLIRALGEISIHSEAADSLGKIGDERAVEPLIKALGHGNSAVATALGKFEDSRALKPLIMVFVKLRLPDGPSPDIHTEYEKWKEEYEKEKNYYAVADALKKLPGVSAEFNRLELYDKAEEFYNHHNMLEEAAATRRKKAEMNKKIVVQGDYVDDRDTIIKDSVLNRSNVGAGGKSKSEELREAKALLDDGIINDDEFKQMKKEILGK